MKKTGIFAVLAAAGSFVMPLLSAPLVTPKVAADDWKVVYSSSEGPEGRALEVLTEGMAPVLRDPTTTTSFLLPLEKCGSAKPLDRKHSIVIGRVGENPVLARYLKPEDVPAGGYAMKAFMEGERRVILLAGDTPAAVLWAAFDFLDAGIHEIRNARLKYPNSVSTRTFFSWKLTAPYSRTEKPATPVRSLFTWGHVIDDYRQFFREMARLRLNRVILWNEYPPLNAREVVDAAHSWGIDVYWGFAWGWAVDCVESSKNATSLKALGDSIFDEWKNVWKPCGGDGIYFQSFTEQGNSQVGGRSIASMVVELVNDVSSRIRAVSPTTDIVFGLHANSVRKNVGEIAKTDPSVEILWENCGGFPFYERRPPPAKYGPPNKAFVDEILSASDCVGLVWKCQVRQDWRTWVHQPGPYMLGCAGDELLERDRAMSDTMQPWYDAEWFMHGKDAYGLLRHVRAGKRQPKELNLVTEYNPPFRFSTAVQAEMFWSTDGSYEDIVVRTQFRSKK